jgi:hypothetical protein
MGQVISFFKAVKPEKFKPVIPALIPVEPEICPLCEKKGTFSNWSTCDICASEPSS